MSVARPIIHQTLDPLHRNWEYPEVIDSNTLLISTCMQPLVEFIPTEIIGLIIDEVVLADKKLGAFKTVKACSLTCYAFLQHSRRHIFSDIYAGETDKLLNFCNLLKDSPWIGQHVRSLWIVLPGRSYSFDQSLLSVHHHLKHMDQLKSIVIKGYSLEWTVDIPLSLRSTIVHLMHLPSVVDIRFIKIIAISPLDLAPCNLHTLTMTSANFMDKCRPLQSIKCHKLYLEDVIPSQWIRHLQKRKLFIDLKGLCIYLSSYIQQSLYFQLLSDIPYLEELDLRISDSTYSLFPSILAVPPPSLKCLKIRIHNSHLSMLTCLIDRLKKVADTAGHLVQHLSFNVMSRSSSISQVPLIQDVLADSSKWPVLQRMSLRVYVRDMWPSYDAPEAGWEDDLKLRLRNFLENRQSNFGFFYSITDAWTEHYDEDDKIDWHEMVRNPAD
ncbi:hypothetical protein JR316_0008931 [Psilocybe cubensis]|uniref:Uncharacterized protein n=1 Tax=Psilocybe cubensis TaxID=181762 RepID=A0ACB8GS41_PSICU|nr:hypothetical protein JR316_0008931 [Psilocybe cubensis]KAH9478476.1 hypothetical protein JR316_0008931 [Psilocybe cubensis]